MYVVLVGSRNWESKEEDMQVNRILDELYQKYGSGELVIVSSSCDKGVGVAVKSRCLKDKDKFQLIDFHCRVFAKLPRNKLAQVFMARNKALLALGEEFHICVDSDRRGAFEDLIETLERAKADVGYSNNLGPHYIHHGEAEVGNVDNRNED